MSRLQYLLFLSCTECMLSTHTTPHQRVLVATGHSFEDLFMNHAVEESTTVGCLLLYTVQSVKI